MAGTISEAPMPTSLPAFRFSRDSVRHPILNRLILTCVLCLFQGIAADASTIIDSGFSAMWYDPARSGEGLQLEVVSADSAVLEWYTYDEKGNQRWLQGVGQISHGSTGDTLDFSQLYVTHGGKFGPSFDPSDVEIQYVGNAALSFSDCSTGAFTYHAFGQSQTLPIARLTQTMGAGCEPRNGVPGQPVLSYAGQTGSWFDPTHEGEGFALQWMSQGQAYVTWYTYDANRNQVWLLGVGDLIGDSINFDLVGATGPHFGQAFDPGEVDHFEWGTLTLKLGCDSGSAHYESSRSGFGTGDLSLKRITSLAGSACPTALPKLSDLYAIAWEELPIDAGTPLSPNYLLAQSIAADGTIAGRRNGHLVLWHPASRTWEDVPREIAPTEVFIAPDASSVIATDDISVDQTLPLQILKWQRAAGWQLLPGDAVSRSIAYSASKNFAFIAGNGHDNLEADQVWIRDIDGAEELLPSSPDIPAGAPIAVSNDGKTAVGVGLRFTSDFPQTIAVLWSIDAAPTVLRNPAGEELSIASGCNADCSIIFGAGLFSSGPNHAHPGEAWLLKKEGTFEYLGALPDAFAPGPAYTVSDVTSDGSLVVGTYAAYRDITHPDKGLMTRIYIWTEKTGIVSLRSLTAELGIGDDDWGDINDVRLSPDGLDVLIGGTHVVQSGEIDHMRAVVLHLSPK
jgi:hypothetical protein